MSSRLISYIAPAAPATRRPAKGNEPYLRPEMGFTPMWFRQKLKIDFGKTWHTDPAYRKETILEMREELRKCFGGTKIGQIDEPDDTPDLITGTFGAGTIAAIFGIDIFYQNNQWPNCEHKYLSDQQADSIEVPDLDNNEFFQSFIDQVNWIGENCGTIRGYMNWQGVLNNAQRLRGQEIFMDMFSSPQRAQRLFTVVRDTMSEAIRRLYEKQKASGFEVEFATVSNCLVNMISPEQYEQFVLPHDIKISETFGCIGVHNCAWKADPYLDFYAQIPNVGYIDMGIESDMKKAKELFGNTRRALMYTPMAMHNNTMETIEKDVRKIADEYGPCDLIVADIDVDTPDDRVLEFYTFCENISKKYE